MLDGKDRDMTTFLAIYSISTTAILIGAVFIIVVLKRIMDEQDKIIDGYMDALKISNILSGLRVDDRE